VDARDKRGHDDVAVYPLKERLPDGQIRPLSDCGVSSPLRKNIPFRAYPKSNLYQSLSRPTEGRHAIVTAAGRDAVDADAPITNGAEADGEVVWS
jgi:hypothetical protein